MSMTPDQFANCRGAKVLVIEPFFYTPHIETSLEIAERLAEENEVHFAGPDYLRCTTDETYRLSSRILIEFSRKRRVGAYLSDRVHRIPRGRIAAMKRLLTPSEVPDLFAAENAELDEIKVGSFDLGTSIRSSLVSLTRDPKVSLREHRPYAHALAQGSVMLYRLTKALVEADGYESVVVFNGRMAPSRAIRRASEELGVRYFLHERGSALSRFSVYDRTTPHSPAGYRDWVDAWWEFVPNPERTARQILDRRRTRGIENWYSFSKHQRAGHAPRSDTRRRVAFFTSSEDEFAAIGAELAPDTPFCDQAFAIRAVGEACRARDCEFVVRFHPNTPDTAHSLFDAARSIADTVSGPESEVDSYALIEGSDMVFCQSSTVGIEAAAMGKPSFYMGRSIYDHCRSAWRIMTEADLSQAFENPQPADPLDALKYANFLGSHGIEHQLYASRGVLSGTYRGRDLNAPLATLRSLKLRLTRGGV